MGKRNRRIDRALGMPQWGAGVAAVTILLVGLLVVLLIARPVEQRRVRLLEGLAPGDPAALVIERMRTEPLRCPVGDLEHLRESFGEEPDDAVDATLERLRERTLERWVFTAERRRGPGCEIGAKQTEVGIGAGGEIVWYVAVTGRTGIRLPAGTLAPQRATPGEGNSE